MQYICIPSRVNFFFLGINLITEGENSEYFYFFTLPTSLPFDLRCGSTFDTLSLQWTDPTIGMRENVPYFYNYNLVKGRYSRSLSIIFHVNHLHMYLFLYIKMARKFMMASHPLKSLKEIVKPINWSSHSTFTPLLPIHFW